jgi:glycosyltransferase involved in cell wall biosynthesis
MKSRILAIHYSPGVFWRYFEGFQGRVDFYLLTERRAIKNLPRYATHVINCFLHALGLSKQLGKYDVFIFMCPPYFHFVYLPILRLCRKPIVTVVMDAYSEISRESLWQAPSVVKIFRKILFPFYLISETLAIKMSDFVFCVSTYLVKKFKRINENVFYCPNGADVAFVSRIKPKKASKCYVYYMGGFLKWRGVDLLFHAFEEVVRKFPNVRLVLAGGLPEELKYYPEILPFLAKSHVIYLGPLPHEEAIAYLKGARIAVLPNRNTVFSRTISSIKVFEYIAAEIPQVCTDSGEHAGWVRKLGVGLVVKDDPKDIAKGITKLLTDKRLYRILKMNCRRAKWEIDSKRLGREWFQYLEELFSSANRKT